VRQELDFAQAELAVKGKKAALGAGMFGGAGLFGLYAVGALSACLILALSTAMVGLVAALIVGVAFDAIAVGLAELVIRVPRLAGGAEEARPDGMFDQRVLVAIRQAARFPRIARREPRTPRCLCATGSRSRSVVVSSVRRLDVRARAGRRRRGAPVLAG
jgi:hypothetical protein